MGQGGEKLRVLVIEDEALVAMMIEDVLAELGHEVVAIAGRLNVALELANQLPIDFAVLDLNLNGERTDPVAASLRSRGIPFLFATGYGTAGVNEMWSGVPVVQKPFQPRELSTAIAAALRR
jgi:DNA-binding response OmpR family regulator